MVGRPNDGDAVEPRREGAPAASVEKRGQTGRKPKAAPHRLIGWFIRSWSRIEWGSRRQNVLILSGALVIAICKIVFDHPSPTTSPADVPITSSHYDPLALRDDDTLKLGAERAVKQKLRDPDSAAFNDEKVVRASGDFATHVCGSVNSRNGFGGMAGAQRFVVGQIVVLEEQETPADFADFWSKLC